MAVRKILLLTLAVSSLASCRAKDKSKEQVATDQAPHAEAVPGPKRPGAKEAAKILSALPPQDQIDKVVNARKLAPYSGPTGTIRGIVRITGDKSPALPSVLGKMDANCTTSRSMFGTVFREGADRTLADVLVAVTEYDGFVPAKGTDAVVTGEGCAWASRTVAMTFGQKVVVRGADNRPYVPEILGQPAPAQLFVLPTAPPVELVPRRPGRFKLVDSMRLFNVAELFVLPYATVDVTDLDGKFEISGVPVGKVKVNALLPQTGSVAGQEVTVEAGKTVELSFELSFDAKAYDELEKPTPLDELPGPEEASDE